MQATRPSKRRAVLAAVTLAAAAMTSTAGRSQTPASATGSTPGSEGAGGPPPWAYGYTGPARPEQIAPPCADARPISCARPAGPVKDDGTKHRMPGTPRTFTLTEVQGDYGPADWFPQDHPAMPSIVAYGRAKDGVRACSLCHYPNGKGKPENASPAGLPIGYLRQQLDDFRSGHRRSADPRKANTNEMVGIARSLTAEEIKAATEYFASMRWTKWVRAVESDTAPRTRQTLNGLFIPIEGTEPLGRRIIEVPENPEQTDRFRNPRSGFVAYVPRGSLAKGEALVMQGGGGKTVACMMCHGADLRGMADVPGIVGRLTSYTVRQLFDMQQGTRRGRFSYLMLPVVANLTDDDMIAIAAYLASREP
jgi:cytochrome c553